MPMFILTKKSSEVFVFGIDFSNRITDDESIQLAGTSIVIRDMEGNDVSSEMLVDGFMIPSDSQLTGQVQAGDQKSDYVAVFTATTTNGNVLVDEVSISVEG